MPWVLLGLALLLTTPLCVCFSFTTTPKIQATCTLTVWGVSFPIPLRLSGGKGHANLPHGWIAIIKMLNIRIQGALATGDACTTAVCAGVVSAVLSPLAQARILPDFSVRTPTFRIRCILDLAGGEIILMLLKIWLRAKHRKAVPHGTSPD